MKIYDVIVLGGGASGLMFLNHISKKKSIALVETNERVAKKLKISGGGKCNITNTQVTVDNFDGESKLVSQALQAFSKEKLLDFLQRNRVPLELRKNRYYFCENSSDEIIDVLKKGFKGVDILLNHTISTVQKEKDTFSIQTDKSIFYAKKVIVATGGKSFKSLGASEIGLEIAKSFDIEVKEFSPALVGLTVQKEQFWMRELSGLSCYVHIKVGQKVLEEEMLFAHKGISGPAVLSASLYWKKGLMCIDFLPTKNILSLTNNSKKLVSSVIPLAKRLSKALLKAVDVQDKECKRLTSEDKEKLQLLHNYSFAPAGNFGFTKAEVSRGGVLSDGLDMQTLEAKKVKGLYFIGEVVDVTGELGGYNFQWAFSSATLCAKSMK